MRNTVKTLEEAMQPPGEWECPVCAGPKFSFEELCRDCQSAKSRATEAQRARVRRRVFGTVL